MIKKVLNTLFMKFFTALAGFLIYVLISHLLGAFGRGQQYLILLNINILLYVLTLLGNSTLVYLTPRKSFSEIFIPSILFSAVVSIILLPIISFIPGLNSIYPLQIVGLTFLASITEINYYVLLGKQEVNKSNYLKLIYPATNIIIVLLWWALGEFDSISKYVFSLWLAYILSAVYGIYLLKDEYKSLHLLSKEEFRYITKILFRLGAVKQLGSIAQMLNYRISSWIFVFVFANEGVKMSGIYGNSTSICESVLLFGTSLALVQYSSLSNTQSNEQAKKLTLKMTGVNVLFTLLAFLVLCLLPSEFWILLFGKEFANTGHYIRILTIGYMFLSTTSNITQYFASRGNFSITASASFLGLIVTAVLCYFLIPIYKIEGAAYSAICSYIITFLVEFIFFLKWIKKKNI